MKNTSILLLSAMLCYPAVTFAQETTQAKNGLPDNPSLWRVLLYKSGQTITKTGDAIQRGAEQSSQAIAQNSEKAGERIEQGADTTGQYLQDKAQQAKTFTQEKWQQGKEAVVGTPNNGNVPIVHGTLSESSSSNSP